MGVGIMFGAVEAVLIVTLKVGFSSMEMLSKLVDGNRDHTTGELNGPCYSLAS